MKKEKVVINFTPTRLREIEKDHSSTPQDLHLYDTQQKGLLIRVKPSGKKTFRIRIWDNIRKREIQENIGPIETITLADARKIVAERISDTAKGIDIRKKRQMERKEKTLNETFATWLDEHAKPKLKRWKQEERRYDLYIRDELGEKKLSEISPEDLKQWRNKLLKQIKQRDTSQTLSPAVVYRILTVLSSIFSKAAPNMHNPCRDVDKHQPQIRTDFLHTDHLKIFFTEVEKPTTPEWLRDYLLLSLYTGARRSNMLEMNWDNIDLELKIWIIPGTQMKNNAPMIIPLIDEAIEILDRRKASIDSEFVFPSPRSKSGHITEPKRAWKKLLLNAGLSQSFRLHDIRRTLGSWQAIQGSSTKLIGASLGHKSEQATAHYAHLTIDPVRKSIERAVAAMHVTNDEHK